MIDYPHIRISEAGPVFRATCRCGAVVNMPQASMHPPYTPAPQIWGKDCPAALRGEIDRLTAWVIELRTHDASFIKAQARGYEAGVRAAADLGSVWSEAYGDVIPKSHILALLEPKP